MNRLPNNILIKIFEYLKLQDQLNIAEICELFRELIKTSVFKKIYKEIEIFKTDKYYIVSNKLHNRFKNEKTPKFLTSSESCYLLNPEDFIKFLVMNCSNIEIFSLVLNKKYKEYNKNYYNDFEYLKQIQLENLLYLNYEGVNFSLEGCVEWLSLGHTNLEKLYLKDCQLENILSVSTFKNINNLKTLEIVNENECKISYKSLKNLLAYEKLETLALNYFIHDFTEEESPESCSKLSSNLKNLTIGCFEYENTFWAFNNNDLKNLNNLKTLTLITTNNFFIMEEFFVSLNTVCKHLESLSLQRCNIKNFIPISTLKSLEFQNCFGLTWQDFRNILSKMNLKRFISSASRYKGEFEYFNINPSLEHISLHYNILNKIKDIFRLNENRLENLASLKWSVDFAKQLWLNPINCPNLETLHARTKNILIENLIEFQSLKYLTLDIYEDFPLMDFLKILHHPSLEIMKCTFENLTKFLTSDRDSLTNEFMTLKTKLKNMSLCFISGICCDIIDLWMNLVLKNRNLTLRIEHSNPNINVEFLTNICGRTTFPEDLNINICGLKIGKSKAFLHLKSV